FSCSPYHSTSPLFPYTTLFRSHCVFRDRRLPRRGGCTAGTRRATRWLHTGLTVWQWFAHLGLRAHTAARTGKSLDRGIFQCARLDRKSTRLNSSHVAISYAVFC